VRVVLIDTGPLVALFNRRDRAHQAVRDWLHEYDGRLVTTWPIVTEVGHLIPERLLPMVLRWAAGGGLEIAELPESAAAALADLAEKYAGRPMDLADASLVWLGGESRVFDVLTLDHADFAIYRTRLGHSFNDLLLS
jgi:predicted nucleic acid-binding protein